MTLDLAPELDEDLALLAEPSGPDPGRWLGCLLLLICAVAGVALLAAVWWGMD